MFLRHDTKRRPRFPRNFLHFLLNRERRLLNLNTYILPAPQVIGSTFAFTVYLDVDTDGQILYSHILEQTTKD